MTSLMGSGTHTCTHRTYLDVIATVVNLANKKLNSITRAQVNCNGLRLKLAKAAQWAHSNMVLNLIAMIVLEIYSFNYNNNEEIINIFSSLLDSYLILNRF